jgi:hypothetical protein
MRLIIHYLKQKLRASSIGFAFARRIDNTGIAVVFGEVRCANLF